MNSGVTRRGFLKGAGGLLLPVAAGMPFISKAELNSGFPRSGTLRTEDDEITVYYFLDSVGDRPPHGALHGQAGVSVDYSSIRASGNTIYLSSASPGFDGAKVPDNCREISITITSYTESDDIMLGGTGEARIRLSNGVTYTTHFSSGGCFLTTACTAARGLPDNCMELQTLRAFRDSYMKTQASDGSSMIREYYKTAPAIVSAINVRDNAAEIYDWMYRDLVVPSVRLIQQGRNARALDHYAGFCMNLTA